MYRIVYRTVYIHGPINGSIFGSIYGLAKNTVYISIRWIYGFIVEGTNEGNAQKCAILHSEGRHLQPLHPIKTIFQIGAVGDLVWRICGKKWPVRHSKSSTCPQIGKLQILHLWTDSYYAKCGACQFGGVQAKEHIKTCPFWASISPLWYLWQSTKIYGETRCIHPVLANPTLACTWILCMATLVALVVRTGQLKATQLCSSYEEAFW